MWNSTCDMIAIALLAGSAKGGYKDVKFTQPPRKKGTLFWLDILVLGAWFLTYIEIHPPSESLAPALLITPKFHATVSKSFHYSIIDWNFEYSFGTKYFQHNSWILNIVLIHRKLEFINSFITGSIVCIFYESNSSKGLFRK